MRMGKGAKIFSQTNAKEAKQFLSKRWEHRDLNRLDEWINDMERLEEGPKTKIHIDSLSSTLKKYQIGKLRVMMVSMDSGLKNSHPSMTDRPSKWINAYKKQTYPKGWLWEEPPSSRETPKRESPWTATDL